jgi:hypothetical protein
MLSWRTIVRRDMFTRMPDEPIFRQRAREAIRTGRLPSRPPDRTWGGNGAGEPCSICGEPIKRDDLELEMEFRPDHEPVIPLSYHLHLRCFAAWELERTKISGTST